VTYVWASVKPVDVSDSTRVHKVTFPAIYLYGVDAGVYYLLYYSEYKRSVIGYSDQLTVSTPSTPYLSLILGLGWGGQVTTPVLSRKLHGPLGSLW